MHRRRMHEVSVRKKEFKCEDCEEVFGQEANLLNHRKVCSGVVASSKERSKCACEKEYSKGYFPRHNIVCLVGVEEVRFSYGVDSKENISIETGFRKSVKLQILQ